MSLEGFKAFNFNEGVPYVSVTSNGITFNKAVTLKLDKPEYAILLINEEEKQIAIKCAEKDEENAVQFYKERNSKVMSVRWNGRDLLNTIKAMMDWDLEKQSYKIEGIYLKADKAMLFDFTKAILLN